MWDFKNKETIIFHKFQNATERHIREDLRTATADGNITLEKLDKAIEVFQKYDIEDKGDLSEALERRYHLYLTKGTHEVVNTCFVLKRFFLICTIIIITKKV